MRLYCVYRCVYLWFMSLLHENSEYPVALFNPLPVHSRVLCAEHRGDTHRTAFFLLCFYSLRGYLDYKDASKMFGSKDYTFPVYHHLAVRRWVCCNIMCEIPALWKKITPAFVWLPSGNTGREIVPFPIWKRAILFFHAKHTRFRLFPNVFSIVSSNSITGFCCWCYSYFFHVSISFDCFA